MLLNRSLYSVKARYYNTRLTGRFLLKLAVGTLTMCLLNKVHFALPFSPVPISLGPSVAVFLGALLGPLAGVSSVGAFLLLGASGLPVFAGTVFGPTWGYLVGYMVGAWCMGKLVNWVKCPTFTKIFSLALVSNLAIYISGCAWLALFIGWNKVLYAGFLPFMPGMLFKDFALATLYMRGKKVLS